MIRFVLRSVLAFPFLRSMRLSLSLLAAGLFVAGASPLGAQPALDSLVPPSPAPNGFIVDRGPVLDAAALARLNERITAVQRRNGGDVGVAILRDLRDRAPSEVGVAIYRAWRIGRVDSIGVARRDLGALLLIVPKELAPSKRGECFITTGRGAEATLIDARAGRICRDSIIPHLRDRRYEPAIAAGIDGIAAAFDDATAGLAPPDDDPSGASASGQSRNPAKRYVAIAFVAVIAIGGWVAVMVVAVRRWRRRRPRPCPNGHGPMARLAEADDDAALTGGQVMEEQLGSVDYDVWACAQCDARLVIPYKRSSPYEGCPKCGHATVQRLVVTLRSATRLFTGLEKITLECANCGWRDETQRTTPVLPPPPPVSTSSGGSSWSGGGGGGGGSSFGGSGGTSGGGGGSSY